jgi:hypothetical protein
MVLSHGQLDKKGAGIYIQRLLERNRRLIREKPANARELFYKGLEKPMSASERKMRERIRRKAFRLAYDLARIYTAGILPYHGGKNDPFREAKSAEVLVGRIEDFITCLMVTETKEEAAKLFHQILKLGG